MNPSKFFLKSKTVIGILAAALVQLAPELGFSFSEDDSAMVNDAVDAVITAMASVLALYGRFAARDNLTMGRSDPGTTLRASTWATLLAVVVITLAGCTQVPSQNHGVVAATQTIRALTQQTDRLQRNGVITDTREDAILDRLAEANSQLRLAESLMDDCPEPCREADDILVTVDGLLTDIETELRNAQ